MPSTHPTRRRLLAGAGSGLAAALAGCLASDDPESGDAETTTDTATTTVESHTVSESGTIADDPPGPEPYPDRPTDGSRAAAVEFVEAFEYARTYNSLHEDDVEKISVDAVTHYDRADNDGHYVLARGSGYANYSDGAHADWGQATAFYYVEPSFAVRTGYYEDHYSDCEDVFASDDPDENFSTPCEEPPAGFRAYNLSPNARTLEVSVEYRGEVTTEVFADQYFLGTIDAIEQESVTYRKGTYRVTARVEDGPTASADWELQREASYRDPPLCILVEPTGALTIRRVPFHEL